jgi:hypothetical protein
MEQWRTANESFMKSIRESGLGEEAVKQTKELRKTSIRRTPSGHDGI